MITPKIKNLFQLIEFLHSNIENFNQYNEVINEVHLLDKERYILNPEKNFADKLKYDEIQAEIKEKFKVIDDNIINPVNDKANELNIWNPNEFETMHNWNIAAISDLIDNFGKDDLPEIFSHKSKYLEYRLKTKGETFFTLSFFFSGLDEILKEIFDYFKEPELYKTDFNEFEAFETKAIQVNDIGEAVKLFQSGKFQKFTFPNSFLNPSTIQQQPNIEPLPPQPIIESPFSVLEWATIFYYADETKLLSESRLLKTRLEQFMSKHQVNTTPVNFKNSYYEAKRRINEKNDYPINKLELIIPFLKENYRETVTKVENDIIFLEENKPEY